MVPWDIHPDLTKHRLSRIADVLRRARDSAARDAKRGLGDTLWSIGCTAYERSKFGLYNAAKDEYRDWLSLTEVDGHLLVKVRMVPLRFYRGFDDQPIPSRYAEATEGEKTALQTAFEAEGLSPCPGHMRVEVSTTPKGFATSIAFYQADEAGNRVPKTRWIIPRAAARRKRRMGAVVESLKEQVTSSAIGSE